MAARRIEGRKPAKKKEPKDRHQIEVERRLQLCIRRIGELEAENAELVRQRAPIQAASSGLSREDQQDALRLWKYRCTRLQQELRQLKQKVAERDDEPGSAALTERIGQRWLRWRGRALDTVNSAFHVAGALADDLEKSGSRLTAGQQRLLTDAVANLRLARRVLSTTPILQDVDRSLVEEEEEDGESKAEAAQDGFRDTLTAALHDADAEIESLRSRVAAAEARSARDAATAEAATRSAALLPHYRSTIERYRGLARDLASRLQAEEAKRAASEDQARHWSRAWAQLDSWIRAHPYFNPGASPPPSSGLPPSAPPMPPVSPSPPEPATQPPAPPPPQARAPRKTPPQVASSHRGRGAAEGRGISSLSSWDSGASGASSSPSSRYEALVRNGDDLILRADELLGDAGDDTVLLADVPGADTPPREDRRVWRGDDV